MSIFFVTEFAAQARDVGGHIVQGTPAYPATAEHTVAISGASARAASLQANTTIVELVSDVICSIEIGANPTATVTSRRLAANVPVQIGVPANSGFQIAAIANT